MAFDGAYSGVPRIRSNLQAHYFPGLEKLPICDSPYKLSFTRNFGEGFRNDPWEPKN